MKKFSEAYLNNIDILKNAVAGFEFEFYTKKSYYKFLELMNREMDPIKFWGFRKYHSKFKPDENNFKLEPDLSGGYDMVEIVTGPMPYVNARIVLLKILKLLQIHAETDDKCSIHINLSFDKDCEKSLDDLNILRLVLDVDEDFVYKFFPDRENNYYAKSVKRIIPFKGYHYAHNAAHLLVNNLELPDTKYFGINTNNIRAGRIEYRYVGGKDYQFKTAEILQLMDYFILLTWNNLDAKMDDDDMDKLREYLSENIAVFKNFEKYEDFIGEFPSIGLKVDKKADYAIVNTYYGEFKDKLFDLIMNTYNLHNCIINYDTETQLLEVVEANVKAIFDVKGIEFIDCNVEGGNFDDCRFISCNVKNVFASASKIMSTEVFKSKLTGTYIDQFSTIDECYFYNGVMNGQMRGGVFRRGRVGEYGTLDDRVRIISDTSNWFNQRTTDVIDKKGKGKFVPLHKKKF